MTDPILGALGLALRAGALCVGEAPVQEGCARGRARLVLLSSDAADNSADKARRAAERHSVPLARLPRGKEAVGRALGRRVCAVMAVADAGFAALILSKLDQEDQEVCAAQAALLEEKARREKKPAGKAARSARARSKAICRRWPV